MNLDELRSIQNKERQKDSLQHLRESFYEDVAAYVEDLKRQRDRAAEAADDPFASPEVRQLTDEIETVTDVTQAIYERRLGKLVKRASLAAADMPADDEGLTAEERDLFNDLVDRIEHNKSHVLDVVEGEADPGADPVSNAGPGGAEPASNRESTGVSDSLQTDPESSVGAGRATDEAQARSTGPEAGRGDRSAEEAAEVAGSGPDAESAPDEESTTTAADAMGGAERGRSRDVPPEGDQESGDARPSTDGGDRSATSTTDGTATGPTDDGAAGSTPSGESGQLDGRTTVRITRDVGEIFGVDEREYELTSETVVTLPEENAEPLLQRGAAERVE